MTETEKKDPKEQKKLETNTALYVIAIMLWLTSISFGLINNKTFSIITSIAGWTLLIWGIIKTW